jgi:hypothetical protein
MQYYGIVMMHVERGNLDKGLLLHAYNGLAKAKDIAGNMNVFAGLGISYTVVPLPMYAEFTLKSV